MQDRNLSLGEKRIRTTFNPSDDSTVQHLKERGAETINYINTHIFGNTNHTLDEMSEITRLKVIAMQRIEEGIMFAVKAATV